MGSKNSNYIYSNLNDLLLIDSYHSAEPKLGHASGKRDSTSATSTSEAGLVTASRAELGSLINGELVFGIGGDDEARVGVALVVGDVLHLQVGGDQRLAQGAEVGVDRPRRAAGAGPRAAARQGRPGGEAPQRELGVGGVVDQVALGVRRHDAGGGGLRLQPSLHHR